VRVAACLHGRRQLRHPQGKARRDVGGAVGRDELDDRADPKLPTPKLLVLSPGLNAVPCASARACTAVGGYGTHGGEGSAIFVEHWDGRRWTIQSTPKFPAAYVDLYGVSCVSVRACTAVGDYVIDAGAGTLAERWNGRSWTIQSTPKLKLPDDFPQLNGVSCVSARLCTAVGYSGTSNRMPLAERWDGTRWAVQPIPNPPTSEDTLLTGVSCASARACTAVGTYSAPEYLTLAERWDGSRWTIQSTPNPSRLDSSAVFDAVSCASARACTVVGGYNTPTGSASQVQRWDGTTWTIQPAPNPAGAVVSNLNGVSCASASTCTAVGDYYNNFMAGYPAYHAFIESTTPPSHHFTVSRITTEADGTINFSARVAGPGSLDVLATAWKNNRASAAVMLKPAAKRFVFARKHQRAARHGIVTVTVTPNSQGRLFVAHPRYRVVLRLWVSYTPDGGRYRTIGFLGLHLPGSCAKHNSVTALKWRTVVRCN
jgi:hypothetical protein